VQWQKKVALTLHKLYLKRFMLLVCAVAKESCFDAAQTISQTFYEALCAVAKKFTLMLHKISFPGYEVSGEAAK
jgi:hypothetical protein